MAGINPIMTPLPGIGGGLAELSFSGRGGDQGYFGDVDWSLLPPLGQYQKVG